MNRLKTLLVMGFGLMGLMGIGMGIQNKMIGSKEKIQLDQAVDAQLEEGAYIGGTVSDVVDYYCSEGTQSTASKTVQHEDHRYYLIPYGEEAKLIGVKVSNADFNKYEEMADAGTDENAADVPGFEIEGILHRCDDELEGYLESYFKDADLDYKEYTAPYYIETRDIKHSGSMIVSGIGLLMIAIFFRQLFYGRKARQRARERA